MAAKPKQPKDDGIPREARVPADSLVLDPANARVHGPDSLRVIKASLQAFGQVEPLVVQASTRKVIAGNGRLAAMLELGWAECSVILLDVDNTTAAALSLAMNRTAERSEWDAEAVARQLKAIREDGFNVAPLGWEPFEVEAMVGTLDGSLEAVDDPEGEWEGMPAYEQEDKRAARTIHVHFADEDAVRGFAALIGRTITEKTKYLWFPEQEEVPHGEAR